MHYDALDGQASPSIFSAGPVTGRRPERASKRSSRARTPSASPTMASSCGVSATRSPPRLASFYYASITPRCCSARSRVVHAGSTSRPTALCAGPRLKGSPGTSSSCRRTPRSRAAGARHVGWLATMRSCVVPTGHLRSPRLGGLALKHCATSVVALRLAPHRSPR